MHKVIKHTFSVCKGVTEVVLELPSKKNLIDKPLRLIKSSNELSNEKF